MMKSKHKYRVVVAGNKVMFKSLDDFGRSDFVNPLRVVNGLSDGTLRVTSHGMSEINVSTSDGVVSWKETGVAFFIEENN